MYVYMCVCVYQTYLRIVFGKVVDGLDVVDKIEGVGSQSGRTSKKVVVKDCGQL